MRITVIAILKFQASNDLNVGTLESRIVGLRLSIFKLFSVSFFSTWKSKWRGYKIWENNEQDS